MMPAAGPEGATRRLVFAPRTLAVLIATGLALGISGCSQGERDAEGRQAGTNQSIPAAERLAEGANQSLISLRGDVVSTTPTTFLLDYGSGRIVVEMDDWDWFKEGRALSTGDDVFVTGRLDRDRLEQGKIEASSVYAVNLGTYFYASGTDEEDSPRPAPLGPIGTTDVAGTIASIDGREFIVGDGGSTLRIDTGQMADNPMDAEGAPPLRPGDRVYAWGRLDVDGGEPGELAAQGLIRLRADRTKRNGTGAGRAAEQKNDANMVIGRN